MSATPVAEATKTRKTRRTVKERIHALLGEVRELVDKHFDSSKTPSVTRTSAPIVTAINTPALLATAAPVKKTRETRKTNTKVAEGSVGGAATSAAAAPTITQEEAKKLPSCPGGPKAFNEFVKKYRSDQKEKGRELSYQEALKEAGPVFKTRCRENGSSAAANEARKAARREKRRKTQKVAFKSPTPEAEQDEIATEPFVGEEEKEAEATATRVSPAEATATRVSPAEATATRVSPAEAEAAATAGRVSPQRSLAEVAAPAPYLNEGLDNSQGMQKIVLEDVPYFMTLADKGLFKRTEDGNVGDWVGYLEEGGKIRETNQPDKE
jgi:hypothetical protein